MSAAASLLASLPLGGKSLAGVLVGSYLLGLGAPGFRAYFSLVAGKVFVRPWQILTSGLVEDSLPALVVFVAGVLLLTRVVEPAYGPRSLFKLLAVAQAGAGAGTAALVIACYYVSAAAGEASPLASMVGVLYHPVCGFQAGFGALLVACKQLIPDNEVAVAGGALRFRAKHLAAGYVVAMLALSALVGFFDSAPFALLGTYTAWLYLRFFHVGADGVRGDASEDFAFASFFPRPMQPAVSQLATACAKLTRLQPGVPATSGTSLDQAARGYALGGGALPGSAADDATRRRERGAKALEERLGLKKAPSGGSVSGMTAGATMPAPAKPQPPEPAPPPAATAAAERDLEAGGMARGGDEA